jgi:hypothetical protein
MPELTITSPNVHSRVDSNTFTLGIGQPYARVDLKPLPESTLSPSQGLWIWPLFSGQWYSCNATRGYCTLCSFPTFLFSLG